MVITVTINAPSEAEKSVNFNVSGIVYEDGEPLSFADVVIYYNNTQIGFDTTGIDGDYLDTVHIDVAGDWQLKSVCLGATSSLHDIAIYEEPTVTTQAATGIDWDNGTFHATFNGTITDTGHQNCDERGFQWGYSSGTYPYVTQEFGSFGTGAFDKYKTGFTGKVYFRARAKNDAGWGYGSERSFAPSPPDPPTNVQATDGAHTDRVVITWTGSERATGYQVYRNGTPLGWLGDIAIYNDYGAGAPSITLGNAVASDGSYTNRVYAYLSGTGTNNGTVHTYKVKARNAGGESGFSGTNTGYRKPGTLYYQWYKSVFDSDDNYAPIGGATSSTYNDYDAPAPTVTPGTASASDGTFMSFVTLSLAGESANNGAGRYYKCYLTAAGCSPGYSGSNRGYRGVGSLTYQWYRSAGDSDASYSLISGGTTDPYNDTAAPAPTINHGSITASDGTYSAYVRLVNSGASTNVGAGRYFKCLVSASGAAAQYSTSNRGYRGVGSLTHQWYRSAGDSDGGYSSIVGATSSTYNDTGAPAPTITKGTVTATDGTYTDKVRLDASGYGTNNGAGRYYKCYHTATGAVPGYTGSNRGYRAPGALNRQWQKSAVDSDGSYSDISGATSDPYDYTEAPAPTITPGTAIASDGIYYAYVRLTLAGESANIGAGRYYRAKYTASGCTTQYTSGNRGYRGVGSLTHQWRRSAADSDADYDDIVGATYEPYNDTGAPSNGDGRWYYCRLNATGATQQDSTHNRGYRMPPVTMIGGPTSWVWGNPVADVSIVPITSDGGLTWIWGVASGTIIIPLGSPTDWSWEESIF